MLRNLAFLGLALALTGCIAQSDIQADYMSQESDCRHQAQRRPEVSENENASNMAYRIGSAFSSCMNKSGWKVSVPKPPGPPPGAVATAPGATTPPVNVAPITRTAPMATTPPANVAPVHMQQPLQPTSPPAPIATPRAAAPAANYPASMPAAPSDPGYTTYQPARPSGIAEPDYGSGAGRNF